MEHKPDECAGTRSEACTTKQAQDMHSMGGPLPEWGEGIYRRRGRRHGMSYTLRCTKDYTLFSLSKENRPLNVGKCKDLRASMTNYGWLPAYPMHVTRIWGKEQTMPSYSDAELAWTSLGGVAVKMFRYCGNGLLAVEKERWHPTQKPLALMSWCISLAGDVQTILKGRLVIVDGQHRYAIAKELGLAVYFVETENHVDVAAINRAQNKWAPLDYAMSFAQRGNKEYAKLLQFHADHNLPISVCMSLLTGSPRNADSIHAFREGRWSVTDVEFAENVAAIHSSFVRFGKFANTSAFLSAVGACCHVPNFKPSQLIAHAHRCPQKLLPYSTRDAMLQMLEEVYNYGMGNKMPLRLPAIEAMEARNPARSRKRGAA